MSKIPKQHDDMDPLKIKLGDLVLGRRKHPEKKNNDIILFGTLTTATAFARYQFKSSDDTYKITVKSFYQVSLFFNFTIHVCAVILVITIIFFF